MTHFKGRVQGVGFRYTTLQIASRLNVRGFVRNLPDGRVELVVEAGRREVERLVAEIETKMSGYIVTTESRELAASGEFATFEIRR